MNETIASPGAWLNELAKTIQNPRCKIDGVVADHERALKAVQDLFVTTRSNQKTLWWVGNGGSNALTSHLSQDVLNKLKLKSHAINDAALITCMANDFGYENVYSRPLDTLVTRGDLLIAVSSSGRSKNILNCADLAIKKGMNLITLSAFSEENELWLRPANVSFYLPNSLYGQVEVGHEAILHAAIETLYLHEKETHEKGSNGR